MTGKGNRECDREREQENPLEIHLEFRGRKSERGDNGRRGRGVAH